VVRTGKRDGIEHRTSESVKNSQSLKCEETETDGRPIWPHHKGS